MSHHFLFESPLPPEDVLAALAAYAADWRESTIPAGLRRRGLLALYVALNGPDFRIDYGPGASRRRVMFVCEGTVSPRTNGGSVIRANLRREITYLAIAALGAALTFMWALVTGQDLTTIVVTGVVAGAVTGSYLLQRYLPVSPHTPEGDEFRRLLRRAGEGHIPLPVPQN